jgi:hypothetical protein
MAPAQATLLSSPDLLHTDQGFVIVPPPSPIWHIVPPRGTIRVQTPSLSVLDADPVWAETHRVFVFPELSPLLVPHLLLEGRLPRIRGKWTAHLWHVHNLSLTEGKHLSCTGVSG